jgi:hypothetical protein
MWRALPGRMIDLIHDGVPASDLRAGGDAAVRKALVRTAMSAQTRGWSSFEWEAEILDARHNLGNQARLKRRRPRGRLDTQKALASAWDYAWECRTQTPAWSADDIRDKASDRASAMTNVVADADNDLTEAQRRVLLYAIQQTQDRGLLQVALPRQPMLTATGLGLTALRTALRHLESKGLLFLEERGKPRGQFARQPRANLYALPEPEAIPSEYRVPRPVGPPRLPVGPPLNQGLGPPPFLWGPPTRSTSKPPRRSSQCIQP